MVALTGVTLQHREKLEELEFKLLDMRANLRKMDYHAPGYLRELLTDLVDSVYRLYRLSKESATD